MKIPQVKILLMFKEINITIMTYVSNLEHLVFSAKRFAKSFFFLFYLILIKSKMMDNIILSEDFKGHKWMKVQAFLHFGMELSSPKPKKILIWIPKKLFLMFWSGTFQPQPRKANKSHLEKNLLYFCKKKFFPHFGMTADQ